MTAKRIVLALLAVAIPTLAVAQARPETERERGDKACNRDVSRFCKDEIQQGETLVLGCLKQNASKISRPCRKVLEDNGQL